MIGLLLNIAAFVLAIYLSVIGRRRSVQIVAWLSALLITSGNIFVFLEGEKEKPYLGLVAPHVPAMEAFEAINRLYKDNIESYDLVDVIGSYYIGLEKPDRIFHRFPEWVFVFRHKRSKVLVEYRVSDSRLPTPPLFDDIESRIKKYWRMRRAVVGEANELVGDGYLVYYVVAKKGIYIGSPLNKTHKTFLEIFDKDGKNLISTAGTGPEDHLPETSDGITAEVIARAQIVGRVKTYVSEWTETVNINKMRTLIIRTANLSGGEFYRTVSPIRNWTIGIDEAIAKATGEGGKGFALGKPRIGGPGIVRLYNGRRENMEGSYTSEISKAVVFDVNYETKTQNEGIDINTFLSDTADPTDHRNVELELVRLLENGVSLFRSGNYEEAIQRFTKAVELSPEHPEGYINRGLSYARLGMHERAIEDYTKGISIQATSVAYVNRSISYKQMGQYDLAIYDAERAIELDAENDEAYFTRGNSYRVTNQLDQAVADYAKTIELNPLHSDAYYNRGTLLGQYWGRHKDAVRDFSRAIQLNSNDTAYYINRAIAYLSLGERDKACFDLNSACLLGSCEDIRDARRKGICE